MNRQNIENSWYVTRVMDGRTDGGGKRKIEQCSVRPETAIPSYTLLHPCKTPAGAPHPNNFVLVLLSSSSSPQNYRLPGPQAGSTCQCQAHLMKYPFFFADLFALVYNAREKNGLFFSISPSFLFNRHLLLLIAGPWRAACQWFCQSGRKGGKNW